MRRGSLRWVRQVLAQKGTAKQMKCGCDVLRMRFVCTQGILLYLRKWLHEPRERTAKLLFCHLVGGLLVQSIYSQQLYIINIPYSKIEHIVDIITSNGVVVGTLHDPFSSPRDPNWPFVWTPKGLSILPALRRYEPAGINIRRIYPWRISDNGRTIYFLAGWNDIGSENVYSLFKSEAPFLLYQPIYWYGSQMIINFFSSSTFGIPNYFARQFNRDTDHLVVNAEHNFLPSMFYYISNIQQDQFRFQRQFDTYPGAMVHAIAPDAQSIVGTIPYPLLNHPFWARWISSSSRWDMQIDIAPGALVAVNRQGVAVGYRREGGQKYPLIWKIGEAPVMFHPLPTTTGFTPYEGWFNDISDNGIAIGTIAGITSGGVLNSRAFQWASGRGIQYLDNVYGAILPAGWHFVEALAISPNGRYLLVQIEARFSSQYSCLVYGVIDVKGRSITPKDPIVVYRNVTEPNRGYPYIDDDLEFRVFIPDVDKHYTMVPFTGDCDQISNIQDVAELRWLHTGTNFRTGGGEAPDFTPGRIPEFRSYGKYYNMSTVLQWLSGKVRFSWYKAYLWQDKETTLTSYRGSHTGIYPPYKVWSIQTTDWVKRARLPKGTHRIIVRAIWEEEGTIQVSGLYQPTPGPYTPNNTPLNWNLTWSQNCNEAHELAVRVSVRDKVRIVDANRQLTTHGIVTSVLRRAIVEWLSSFIRVPYEWGGHWYGGRADTSHGAASTYEGYGIDCSGLISAAAVMAGFNAFQTRWWRANTSMLMTNTYSEPVDLNNIEPGDILVKPGHVVAVYRVHGQAIENGAPVVDLDIIHACGISDDVAIYTGIRITGRTNRWDQVFTSTGGRCEADPLLDRSEGAFRLGEDYLAGYYARRLR